MNKLLPILLVVVLSGCSGNTYEFICKAAPNNVVKKQTVFMSYNNNKMILQFPSGTTIHATRINSEDNLVVAIRNDDKDNARPMTYTFHKKLKTFRSKSGETRWHYLECKENE